MCPSLSFEGPYMGVDFFACSHCGETICDAGSYETCGGVIDEENLEYCSRAWCDEECAKGDGYDEEKGSCKYCRNEELEDYELVSFLLQRLRWTREKALDEYFKRCT